MKIDDGKLIFSKEDVKKLNMKMSKRISGHAFANLLGLNNFKKVGDALLELHGVIVSDIDSKYLVRGNFAEAIIFKVYTRDNPDKDIVRYNDKKAINYNNFNKDSKVFCGIIDIENKTDRYIVEVKSKSMSTYDFISKYPPKDELYQALFYAYLRKYDKCIMEWVFFDEESENSLFKGEKPKTLKNLKRISKEFVVDYDEMANMCYLAKEIVDDFRKTLTIPLEDISDENICILKKMIKEQENEKENQLQRQSIDSNGVE